MIDLIQQFPNSAFQVSLYRLTATNTTSQSSFDLNLVDSLNYDFMNELDSRYSYFWRNLYKYDDSKYRAFFSDNATKLQNDIRNSTFDLMTYDLTPYFIGYTLVMDLNTVAEAVSLDIKQSEFEIKANDMIVIQEVVSPETLSDTSILTPQSQVIFIGFVTNISNSLKYGDFLTQTITLLNLGKMYSLAKITVDPALSDYAIKGLDNTRSEFPVNTDIFNELDVFQIIEKIYNTFFFGSVVNKQSDIIEYTLDEAKAKAFTNFNLLFPFVYTLYLYKQQYYPDFKFCKITNGKHKAFNEQVRGALKIWLPSYQTAGDIISTSLKASMYDYFFDYNGELIIRPPLYNFFPLNNFNPTNGSDIQPSFKNNGDFVITRDMITEYSFSKDNIEIQSRTDAYFSWPYTGVYDQFTPQFFIDLPAFIKFGFRNETPYNNPNAMSEKTGRILSMMYNMKINNATRVLDIKIRTDKPLAEYKYELGRLYYIDLPDLKSIGDNADEIQAIIDGNKTVTNSGVMGYLISIKKAYQYGEYILYDLIFSFVRNIEILDLDTIKSNTTAYNNVLDDLYSIYGDNPTSSTPDPYGFQGKLQLMDGAVDENTYNTKHKQAIAKFQAELKAQSYFNNIPIFRTLPSVLDLIDLTYSDKATQDAISKNVAPKEAEKTVGSDTVKVDNNGYMVYKSYRFKMQNFFDYEQAYGLITYKDPIGNLPYYVSVAYDAEVLGTANIMYAKTLNKALDNLGQLQNYQTNDLGKGNNFPPFKMVSNTNVATYIDSRNNKNDDSWISVFRTWMPHQTYGGDDLSRITQKLFNRIIECDSDLTYFNNNSMPYYKDMFWLSSAPTNNDMNIPNNIWWDSPQKGDPLYWYPYLTSKLSKWTLAGAVNIYNIPSTVSGTQIDVLKNNLPIGIAFERTLTIPSTTTVTDTVNKGDYSDVPVATPITLSFDPTTTGSYYFSPAFFFNLQTILYYNTLLAVTNEADSTTFAEKGVTDAGQRVNPHKEGRAIDFFMPARNDFYLDANGNIVPAPVVGGSVAHPMPFVMFGLNGNYTLKQVYYDYFEQMLQRYFDVVIKTQETMKVDMNMLKGTATATSTPDIKTWAVNVYHIEVNDKDYLNTASEVMFNHNHCLITTIV